MDKDKSPESKPAADAPPSKDAASSASSKSTLDLPVDALRQPKAGATGASAAPVVSAESSKSKASTNKSTPSASTPKGPSNPSKPATTEGGGGGGGGRGVGIGIGVLAVIVIAGLSAVVWWQNQRFETVAREVADRLQQGDARVAQIEKQSSQALSLARSQAQTVEQTTSRLRVMGNEITALEQSWQASNVGLDQKLLVNDLRRLLTMANQQLVLMGNVSSAIAVLQSMQVMLESQVAPEFKGLTQAVGTDLSRLQAVPLVDLAAISAQLDSLIALSGSAPLLVPDRVFPDIAQSSSPPTPAANNQIVKPDGTPDTPSPASHLPWWQQLPDQAQRLLSEASRVMRDEVSSLVSIRRANDPQALLLSDEQAQELRANVRSRLLSAQLALLTRQTDIWHAELAEVGSLLRTRYDTEAIDTKAAMRVAQSLIAKPLTVPLPALTDSLSALELLDRTVSVPTVSGAN